MGALALHSSSHTPHLCRIDLLLRGIAGSETGEPWDYNQIVIPYTFAGCIGGMSSGESREPRYQDRAVIPHTFLDQFPAPRHGW